MHDIFKKADLAAPAPTVDPLREQLRQHSRRLGALATASGVGGGAIDAFIYQNVPLSPDARRALAQALSDPGFAQRGAAQSAAPKSRLR